MITEILTFQLKPDTSLADPSSPASKVVRESLAPGFTAHGARYVYYGQFKEKPEAGIMIVGWSSTDDQQKFADSPNHETHVKHLQSIIDNEKSTVTDLHVSFFPSDDPSPALGAHSRVGVTEFVFFYFPSTLTSIDVAGIMASVDKLRPCMARSEALDVYDGWALEEAVPNPGPQASEGEVSKVYVNVVGWVDVEAHMRTQQGEDFKANIHHLVGIKEIRHAEFYHAKMHVV